MVDAAARRHYVGETRPVEIKQKAREGSAAHHEYVGAKNEAAEATVTRVNVDSGYGGASDDDGGAQATVMDKMSKQQGNKHHGIEMEL